MEYKFIKPKSKREIKRIDDQGLIIAIGGNSKVNRLIVESNKVNIIIDAEPLKEKDFMDARNSGLNHILCKLAKKNNVAIGFHVNNLIKFKENRLLVLGRMMQNVKLCNKYKVKMFIVNTIEKWYDERDTKDLKSFSTILGIASNNINIIKIKR